MISTDFAPNEQSDDALASLITITRPWTWYKGRDRAAAMGMLAEFFPGTRITPFLSGRSALSILLSVLSFPEGSEVIVQGFTCEAVPVPVLHNKLIPVYVDIEKETFSLDIDDLNRKITPRTKALILQHSFGMVPRHRDRVLQLAKDRKIFAIEDLAHGFTPEFWQNKVLSDSQALTLSFGRSKALSSVFGGAIVTADRKISDSLARIEAGLPYPSVSLMLRLLFYKPLSIFIKSTYNIGLIGKLIHKAANISGLIVAEISKKEKEGYYDPYLEKKYPNGLAILLVEQLRKFGKTIRQRHTINRLYGKAFGGTQFSDSMPRFPLLVPNKIDTYMQMRRKNIYIGNWYAQPIAPVELDLERVGYRTGSCPTSEKVCKDIINLPTLITEREAMEIIGILNG